MIRKRAVIIAITILLLLAGSLSYLQWGRQMDVSSSSGSGSDNHYEEYVFGEIPHELLKHIDYHSYGSELEMDDRYLFTTSGVFRYQ